MDANDSNASNTYIVAYSRIKEYKKPNHHQILKKGDHLGEHFFSL